MSNYRDISGHFLWRHTWLPANITSLRDIPDIKAQQNRFPKEQELLRRAPQCNITRSSHVGHTKIQPVRLIN